MQATSDKTASANFTQTGGTAKTNFGADADKVTNGKTGYAPYYQWGRKDPFRSSEYTAAPADGTSLIFKNESVTVGTSIKNPTTFYGDSYTNSYTPVYNNAWNATYATFNVTNDNIAGLNKTVKTVYDPCPVGYAVPSVNTFTTLSNDNTPISGNGRAYTVGGKTLFFPWTGRRPHSTGKVHDLTSDLKIGYSWESVRCDDTRCRQLRYDNNANIYPSFSNLNSHSNVSGSAHCIRPVREN